MNRTRIHHKTPLEKWLKWRARSSGSGGVLERATPSMKIRDIRLFQHINSQ